jgi:hypothetical protein
MGASLLIHLKRHVAAGLDRHFARVAAFGPLLSQDENCFTEAPKKPAKN